MNRFKKTLALLALAGAGAASATTTPTLDQAHLAYFELLAQAAHAGRTGASFMLNLIELGN